MDVSGHLLRRGVAAFMDQPREGKPAEPTPVIELPTWVIVMLATTAFGFLFVMTMINYTFGRIVPTLVMIETPDALFEPLPTIDPDTDTPLDAGAAGEPVALKQQTISSSFRRTLKHLKAKGGFPARFRGFSIYLVNMVLMGIITGPISSIPFVPSSFGSVLAAVLLANFSTAWTHIVISEPSAKPWFRRIPSRRQWKKVALPAAALAVAEQLSIYVPLLFSKVYRFDQIRSDNPNLSGGKTVVLGFEAFSVFVLGVILSFFLVLPANVVLTRVQASLLDDAEETIVPFDRTFSGKVVPEIVGGSGVISMTDAWKTFDWAARVRLVKTYAKVLVLQILLGIAFFSVLAIEFFAIAQADLSKVLPGDGGKGSKDL